MATTPVPIPNSTGGAASWKRMKSPSGGSPPPLKKRVYGGPVEEQVGLVKIVGGSPGGLSASSQVRVPSSAASLNTRLRLVMVCFVALIPRKHPSFGPSGRLRKVHSADESETEKGDPSKIELYL